MKQNNTEQNAMEQSITAAILGDAAFMEKLEKMVTDDEPGSCLGLKPGDVSEYIQGELLEFMHDKFLSILYPMKKAAADNATASGHVWALDALVEYYIDQVSWSTIADAVAFQITEGLWDDADHKQYVRDIRAGVL